MEYFGLGLDGIKMEESGVAEEVIVMSQEPVSGDCLICSTGLTSEPSPSKFNTDLLLDLCKILKISSTFLDHVEIDQDSWLPCPLYCASCEDTIRECLKVFEEIKDRERVLDSLVSKIKTYFIASYCLPYANYNGNYPHTSPTSSNLATKENRNNFGSNQFQFSPAKNACCDAKFQIRKTFAQCWSNCTVNVNHCNAKTRNTSTDYILQTQGHPLENNKVKNDPDNETDDFTHSHLLPVSSSFNCTVNANQSETPVKTGTGTDYRLRIRRRPGHTPATIQLNKSDSEIDSDDEFQEDSPYISENVSERGEDQDSNEYDSDNLNKNDVKSDPDTDTEIDAATLTQRSPELLVKKCVAKSLRIDKRKQIPGRIYNFTCNKCGKAYDQKNHYLNHLKCHSGKLDVPCNLCHVEFVSSASLKIHKRQAHKDQDEDLKGSEKFAEPKKPKPQIKSTYNCHLCGRGYEKAIHYHNHVKAHQGKLQVRCQICPDKFVSQFSLKQHVQKVHREHPAVADSQSQFLCHIDNCSKTYGSKKLLLVHQKIKHADKIPNPKGDKKGCDLNFDPSGSGKLLSFTCFFCKKEFTRTNSVNSEETAYQCDIFECGKTYPLTQLQKFANHHEFSCTERPKDVFECEFCSKSFYSKANLDNHRIRVHTKTYPYYCDKCGKGQASLATLNTHNRNVHLGYVFKCEVCKLSFKNKGRFTVHMRRHDGDLRYVCGACGKAFLLPDQLKRHEAALHTVGDNTFSCDLCDKSFKTKHYLRNHVWNVHKKSGRRIKTNTVSTRKKSKKGKKQHAPSPPLHCYQCE